MSWGAIAAAVVGAGASYGFSQLDGGGGSGGYPYIEYKQLPDYPEATGARETWWEKLQQWGQQSGYGAISPDWQDIWQRASDKISRYYWGSLESTGLAAKVKASAARRNVSESPALESELTRMGIQEGIQKGDLATEMAYQEALFGEQGRTNWLTSLQSLAGLKPAYATTAGVAPGTTSTGELISSGITSGLNLYNQYEQQDWWRNFLQNYLNTQSPGGMTGITQSAIKATPNIGVGGYEGLNANTVGLYNSLWS